MTEFRVRQNFGQAGKVAVPGFDYNLGIGEQVGVPVAASGGPGNDEPVLEMEPPDLDTAKLAAAAPDRDQIDGSGPSQAIDGGSIRRQLRNPIDSGELLAVPNDGNY